jgi:hypothetical protein
MQMRMVRASLAWRDSTARARDKQWFAHRTQPQCLRVAANSPPAFAWLAITLLRQNCGVSPANEDGTSRIKGMENVP